MNKSAALVATALISLTAQAEGITFNTPVTYTQSVTYAAGVTYLAPVTYGEGREQARQVQAAAEPVMLERVIVTPTRSYAESEWRALRLARADQRERSQPTRYLQVRSESAGQDAAMFGWLRLLVQ